MSEVTYATKEEAIADWKTVAPKFRTEELLREMLKKVRAVTNGDTNERS